ncbi:MAG: TetR family transcriptional regulator [Actinomycetota bacterium]|nr:TetR family transcriptional regulator [Actinomycetota bacterium]
MPKLWSETIEEHRREVRDAILDATIALVEQDGLLSVTMSQIAEATGIGRATLYKYFPDVEAILHAWHKREIEAHLGQLRELRERPGSPRERLAAVFRAFATIAHESQGHRDTELAAVLHRDHEMLRPEAHLHELVRDLLVEAAAAGDVRNDITPGELASYCLHALAAARTARSKAAIERLVEVTLDGLRH